MNSRAVARDVEHLYLQGAVYDFFALLLDSFYIAGLLKSVGDIVHELRIRNRNDGLLGVGAILEADYEI